eukprot:PhM_4_TR14212/c3_g3_i2/m.101600
MEQTHNWEEHATGFSPAVVDEAFKLVNLVIPNITRKGVVAALVLLHLNVSDHVLPIIMRGLGYPVGAERTWRDAVAPVFGVAKETCQLVSSLRQPTRFDSRDLLFPTVTSIVDGVPVFTRGPREYFNGKHHDKMLSFQVLVDLQGDLLSYLGPHNGCQHDSQSFTTPPFVEHRCNELILADLAYIGNDHTLTAFKGAQLSEDKQYFNKVLSNRRSRVERTFGYLDRHHFFHYCARSKEWISNAFALMFSAEICKQMMRDKQRYTNVVSASAIPQSIHSKMTDTCSCTFQCTRRNPTSQARNHYRDKLCHFFFINKAEIDIEIKPKKPQHSKRERSQME